MYLKIGHYTDTLNGTGLSVFLFDQPALGVYHLCGSSPATRDLHVIELESNISEIQGILLTGGSAFGLGAADGVMQYLLEQGLGKRMPHGGVVPIVPTAAIYDLAVKNPIPPSAENAYQACLAANKHAIEEGNIGAGTGASVGKLIPNASRMTGGFGCAMMRLDTGLEVAAYAVVNAVGDIRDKSGNLIAGARLPNGEFADCQSYLLSGSSESVIPPSNTTLVVIITNAIFSKIELKRISKVAISGMARAISPVFTRYDGDVIFCVSLGSQVASELSVSAIAAEVTQQAIINAVKKSITIQVKECR